MVTICYGHWVLRLVISYARQRHELIRAFDATSYNILYKIKNTISYEPWVLCLVISYIRQTIRALISASYNIIHETRATIFLTGIEFCVL